jgi:TonB family protein
MRSIQLLLALTLPGTMGGTDLSGTWIGTWERQGESQGTCLYLWQGDKGVQGQIAFQHDTMVSSIDARLPVGNILEFAIADDDKAIMSLRLMASQTVSAEMVLVGVATTGNKSESIALKKYTVPSIYYQYGKGRMDPVAIRTSRPEYTVQARAAKLQGTVTLLVSIDSSGAVGPDVTVLRGLGLGLDEEAVKCVKKWQFTPPHYDCNPEPVHIRIDLVFTLLAR